MYICTSLRMEHLINKSYEEYFGNWSNPGQIGSELTLELRKRYGDDHVIAGYIPSAMPKGELKASGPSAIADVTDRQSIEVVARQFKIDTIYNLAALLSVVAESRPPWLGKLV